MTAKNPRINVTFEEDSAKVFMMMAKKQHKPVASIVRDLALEALELKEDFFLSKMAEKLDKKNTKLHNHNKAWQ